MSDVLTQEQRHRNMAAIRSTSTKPELKLRHELWRQGFRYRVNDKRLPGKPDMVLPKYNTVIFIHGCFWHGHKECKNYSIPQTNTLFWKEKITKNQVRDQEVWRLLEARGWSVIIVWECQLKKSVFTETINNVVFELRQNGLVNLRIKQERKTARVLYSLERKAFKEKEAELLTELKVKWDNP